MKKRKKVKRAKRAARCQQCGRGKAVVWKEVFWLAGMEYVELHVCERCGRTA